MKRSLAFMKNELCYYSNLSAFKSIIENQTFWLSDIHFMNDSSEENLFLEVLTDVMRNEKIKLSEETKKYLKNKNFINSFFDNIKANYKNVVCICCFTVDKNDDLSQWRGYADDGKGLCIGFKKEFIQALSNLQRIERYELRDGKYKLISHISTSSVFAQNNLNYINKDEMIAKIENIVSPIVTNYDEADKNIFSPNHPDALFTQELYKKTFNCKAFYKNKSFASEEEYRICFFDSLHEDAIGVANDALMANMSAKYEFNIEKDKIELSELKFRQGNDKLIPYREMKFSKDYFSKMLSSITIGPKNPMAIADVKYFLLANGFNIEDIEVKKSESTYQ